MIDDTCIMRKANGPWYNRRQSIATVICGLAQAEQYAKAGYQFDWQAMREDRLRKALAALPHKEEATPAPMGEPGDIEGEKRAFNLGYLIAVSNLVNMHDDTVAAEDLLRALGCSKAEMERFDLTDYDRKPLRRLFREMARKDAHRRATPATTERGRG